MSVGGLHLWGALIFVGVVFLLVTGHTLYGFVLLGLQVVVMCTASVVAAIDRSSKR